jgi:hypothetical protein
MTNKRWSARLIYTDDDESFTYEFDEFDQLGGMVEHGPNWNELVQIVITLNREE